MENYYITNEVAVDRSTERELLNNGMDADRRVSFCAAEDDRHDTYYYLQTNGDPVALTDEFDQTNDFIATLGAEAEEIFDAIVNDRKGDSKSREWAMDTMREQIKALAKAESD